MLRIWLDILDADVGIVARIRARMLLTTRTLRVLLLRVLLLGIWQWSGKGTCRGAAQRRLHRRVRSVLYALSRKLCAVNHTLKRQLRATCRLELHLHLLLLRRCDRRRLRERPLLLRRRRLWRAGVRGDFRVIGESTALRLLFLLLGLVILADHSHERGSGMGWPALGWLYSPV